MEINSLKLLVVIEDKEKYDDTTTILRMFVEKYNLQYLVDFSDTKKDGYGYYLQESVGRPSPSENTFVVPSILVEDESIVHEEIISLFKKYKSLIQGKLKYSTVIVDSIEQLQLVVEEVLNTSKGIFYDLETGGTHSDFRAWFSGSYPICMSFSTIEKPNIVYVIYFQHEDSPFLDNLSEVYETLKPLFDREDRFVCAHNTNFDRAYVEIHFGYDIKAKVHCTIGMHHLLDITDQHGLEYLSKTYLGIHDLKDKFTQERERIRDIKLNEFIDQSNEKVEEFKEKIKLEKDLEAKKLLKESLALYKKNVTKEKHVLKRLPGYDCVPFDVLTTYVAEDTFAGALLYNVFWCELEKRNLTDLFLEYSVSTLDTLFNIEKHGQNWDTEFSSFLLERCNKYIDFIEDSIFSLPEFGKYKELPLKITKSLKKQIIGKPYMDGKELDMPITVDRQDLYIKKENVFIAIDKFPEVEYKEYIGQKVNFFHRKGYKLTSSKQVSNILYEIYKFPVLVKTDSGNPSTSDDAITALNLKIKSGELNDVSPNGKKFLSLLSKHRAFEQVKGTFLLGFPKKIADDGRLHTSLAMHGTRTGRLSSSNPNTQNIPSEENHLAFNAGIKACIKPRHKGNVFIDVDYSGLELRVVAALANDEKMIDAFKQGEIDPTKADIHRHMSAVINNLTYEQVTDEQRKSSKTVNFGILYGKTKEGLARDLGKSIEEVDQIFDALFGSFPSLEKYIKKIQDQTVLTGKVINCFGIEYRLLSFDDLVSLNFDYPPITGYERNKALAMIKRRAEECLRQGVNYTIQGPAGMLTVMAMSDLRKEFKKKDYPVEINITVHDSILIECPEDKVIEVYEEIIRPILIRKRDWLNGVSLDCDCKVGRQYGCMIDYDVFKENPEKIDYKFNEYMKFHNNFDNFVRFVDTGVLELC